MFIITDWANNLVFNGKRFKSEEEAGDHVLDNATDDEMDEFIVIPIKDFKPTQLDTLDLLEGRSYRAQL